MPQRRNDSFNAETLMPRAARIRSTPPQSPRDSRYFQSQDGMKNRSETNSVIIVAARPRSPCSNSCQEEAELPLAYRSKTPKESKRTSRLKPPSSFPGPVPPRSAPASPTLLRHHKSSQSQAMAREFFGQGKMARLGAPPSPNCTLLPVPHPPHHPHPSRCHHLHQSVTSSPLLRRQTTGGAQRVVPVVTPAFRRSCEDLSPDCPASPTQSLPWTPAVEVSDSCHTSTPLPPTQDATHKPCLSPAHLAPEGPRGARSTAGTVTSGPGRKERYRTGKAAVGAPPVGVGSSSASSYFRVVVLGEEGVGKSTLVQQMGAGGRGGDGGGGGQRNGGPRRRKTKEGEKEEEEEEEGEEDRVIVQVEGREGRHTMEILDSPLNANIDVLRPDAFVVMYSVSDRKSYETAKEVTRHLRCELGTDRTVLLVANKTDLKRQQRVPAKEAKDTAEVYDCVFVETSAALRLNVDRLLGKLLREITLQLLPEAVPRDPRASNDSSFPPSSSSSSSPSSSSSGKVLQFLSRLFRQAMLRRSCSRRDMWLKGSRHVSATVAHF